MFKKYLLLLATFTLLACYNTNCSFDDQAEVLHVFLQRYEAQVQRRADIQAAAELAERKALVAAHESQVAQQAANPIAPEVTGPVISDTNKANLEIIYNQLENPKKAKSWWEICSCR